ncbi:MAG TPA: diguanylate cyclase [Pseudoxanthomonas sp.]|nr:diguanylate cyclase [Pseudoxanthomonas sp.]
MRPSNRASKGPVVTPNTGRDQRPLHRVIYPHRIVGMALTALPVVAVLHQRDASMAAWLFVTFATLVWPHLAYVLAKYSADPRRTEMRSLLIDSAIAGAWPPLMHFNLLPSALLLTLSSMDKISTGIRGLWRRSLPGMLLSLLLCAALTDFAFEPVTAMPVILACLPIMLIHMVSVNLSSHRLLRKVRLQNQELDRLHRVDMLTGLSARTDWEQHAERLMQRSAASGEPIGLLLIDIDEFKQINDRHGHSAGDDALRALANTLRSNLRATDRAGRLGGDEFVVLLPATGAAQAQDIAERLRNAVAYLRLREHPGVRLTISIGVAILDAAPTPLRAWLNAADHALYRAKRNGRNRTMS